MAVRDPLVAPVQADQLSGQLITEVQAALGHEFARPTLLREALTHRSALTQKRGRGKSSGAGSNERLEFVGDRVLGLVMAEWLAERFPGEQEGQLALRLAQLVSQPVLADIAEALGLPAALAVGAGESRAGVRTRATVLSDALEATIVALYLDGGLDPARDLVRRAWEPAMTAQAAPPKDPKTELQEWLQGRGRKPPAYAEAARTGPPHDPVFTVTVTDGERTGTGTAGNKRAAERLAAENLLEQLKS